MFHYHEVMVGGMILGWGSFILGCYGILFGVVCCYDFHIPSCSEQCDLMWKYQVCDVPILN